MNQERQRCFVLHSRPYRDTSLLLELFSQEQGKIAAVARGVYNKKNPLRSVLQVFCPLVLSFRGKTELWSLAQVDSSELPLPLIGQGQACGFYVNELLMYALARHDPHPRLFDVYQACLQQLQNSAQLATALRLFELRLLEELGYGIDFNCAEDFEPERYYRYQPQMGFQTCLTDADHPQHFLGRQLQAIADYDLSDPAACHAAKRLTRLALQPLLAGRTIHSRQLLMPFVGTAFMPPIETRDT